MGALTVFHKVPVVASRCKLLSYLRKICPSDLKPRRLVQLLPGPGPGPPPQARLPSVRGPVHHSEARPSQHRPHRHWLEAASVTWRPAHRGPPPVRSESLAMRLADLHGQGSGGRRSPPGRSAEGTPPGRGFSGGRRGATLYFSSLSGWDQKGRSRPRLARQSGSKDPKTHCVHSPRRGRADTDSGFCPGQGLLRGQVKRTPTPSLEALR